MNSFLGTFDLRVEDRNRHIGRLDTQIAELDIKVQDRQRELTRINNAIKGAEELVSLLGNYKRIIFWSIFLIVIAYF